VGKLIRKCGNALTIQSKKGNEPLLVMLNQIRHKIGQTHGNPESTPGGNALRFACSMIVRLYSKGRLVGEVNSKRPTFKDTSGIIKKWKVPIVGDTFEYAVCMIPHNGLGLGEVDAWNTVANYLKSYGVLVKGAKEGWECMGESFKTLEQVHAHYFEDLKFGNRAREMVFLKATLIEGQK
jgi:hypothetical protein